MTPFIRRHPVISYFVLTYAISWLASVPWLFIGAAAFPAVFFVGALGPALAGFAITRVADGRAGVAALFARITRWRVHWGWWCFALFFFPAAMGIATATYALSGGTVPEVASLAASGHPGHPSPLLLLYSLPFAALLEEIGWRGVAFHRLSSRFPPLPGGLLVGAAWACWHLPLFFLPGASHNSIPFLPYLAFALLVSVWHGWLYQKTRSVLLVSVFHATLNYTGLMPGGRVFAVVTIMGTIVFVATLVLVLTAKLHRRQPGTEV